MSGGQQVGRVHGVIKSFAPAKPSTFDPATAMWRTVLFQALPESPDYSVSRNLVLPGKATKETALQWLFEALQGRPDCIGGTIELAEVC
jgi:hypothetical protein